LTEKFILEKIKEKEIKLNPLLKFLNKYLDVFDKLSTREREFILTTLEKSCCMIITPKRILSQTEIEELGNKLVNNKIIIINKEL